MNKIAKTILIIVLCLAVVGGIVGVVAWTQSDKFDQKELSFLGKYEVGGLDSNGNYMSTNASIYTKKPIECQGLNCNLVFDSTISYQLYFYDQNNEFVHTTGKLTGTFTEDGVPFFAKYVRIVITPNDDDKVTSMEVVKYAKQLKVSANREQGFKNYTENLFEVDQTNSYFNLTTGEIIEKENSCVSKDINIVQYKEALLFRGSVMTNNYIFCYDGANQFLGYVKIVDVSTISFVSSKNIYYYNVPFSALLKDTVFVKLAAGSDSLISFCCR